MDKKNITIFSDGGARGNPGPAAGGYMMYLDDEKKCFCGGKYYGVSTNNQAEYRALKDAIEFLEQHINNELTEIDLKVFLDSELMVRQLNGDYQVKSVHLMEFHDWLTECFSRFGKVTISHVSRANNQYADDMVNAVLDRWSV